MTHRSLSQALLQSCQTYQIDSLAQTPLHGGHQAVHYHQVAGDAGVGCPPILLQFLFGRVIPVGFVDMQQQYGIFLGGFESRYWLVTQLADHGLGQCPHRPGVLSRQQVLILADIIQIHGAFTKPGTALD